MAFLVSRFSVSIVKEDLSAGVVFLCPTGIRPLTGFSNFSPCDSGSSLTPPSGSHLVESIITSRTPPSTLDSYIPDVVDIPSPVIHFHRWIPYSKFMSPWCTYISAVVHILRGTMVYLHIRRLLVVEIVLLERNHVQHPGDLPRLDCTVLDSHFRGAISIYNRA